MSQNNRKSPGRLIVCLTYSSSPFLGPGAPSAQRALHRRNFVTHVFDIHFHLPSPLPPSSEGPILGSTSSIPKMDFSPSTLRFMARGIYMAVLPTGLRPRLPIHHSLFSQTRASSHERTAIAARSGPSSSALDRTRVP
jgi:hypothetical protein